MTLLRPTLLVATLALAACATTTPITIETPRPVGGLTDDHLPPYVRRPYEVFSRNNVVAIALREWRAFGNVVNDDPPGQDPPRDIRPDKQPGLWQRVADYWWAGQDAGAKEGEWSSLYNENGTQYAHDAPAWSAAFISYVMRTAGAGNRFTYSPLHADYINAAARGEGILRAENPASYPPRPGDMICLGRLTARKLHFEDLPAPRFFGHCDIVVDVAPGQLSVIGGNVAGSVTMKHVPTTPDGLIATPDGTPVDTRYPWFVVLRVVYDG